MCKHAVCGSYAGTCQEPESDRPQDDKYFLWYDNGSGWYDCASKHATLAEAIAAAGRGWQPVGQRITRGERDVPEARVWEDR